MTKQKHLLDLTKLNIEKIEKDIFMSYDVYVKYLLDSITRKKKLLEKQKEGKKKMRKLGSVEVTPEAFMAVLRLDDGN